MRGSALTRNLATTALRTAAFARFVELLERADRPSRHALTVLMYHRVAGDGDDPDLDPSLLSASPEEFDRQMAFLACSREVVSLPHLLEARQGGRPVPPAAVMVTFDDGYRDFALNAWPVLHHHGLPATLFVATGYPDHPERAFWWDRLHWAFATTSERGVLRTVAGALALDSDDRRADAFRTVRTVLKHMPHHAAMAAVDRLCDDLGVGPVQGRVLGWQDLRRLADEGVSIAPHSRSHPLLDQLPIDEARAEIEGSARDLEQHLGSSHPVFAYPAGGHSDDVAQVAGESGMAVAFTTIRGTNDMRRPDWLRMRRVNVGRRTNLPVLRAQLLSWPLRLDRALAVAARRSRGTG